MPGKLRKAFRVRLMPTEKQEEHFRQHVGCVRKVYNDALSGKIEKFQKCGGWLSKIEIQNLLPEYKRKHEFMYDVESTCLQQSLVDLDRAFQNYFKSKSGQREGRKMGFPGFKALHRARKSFRIVQAKKSVNGKTLLPHQYGYRIRVEGTTLRIPKIGFVEVANPVKRLARFDSYRIVYITIFQDSDGFWYASVLCAVDENQVKNHIVAATKAVVGLDVGVKTTVTDSNGEKVDIPHKIFTLKKKIARIQKEMSRMRKPNRKKRISPSQNWLDAKLRVGKLHCRIKRIRADWQHKYSMELIKNNQVIVMETLDIQGMVKSGGVSKKDFNDKVLAAGWYQLKMIIKYKSEWYGRELVEVDKYFPSSQLCSVCGQQNQVKMLRKYICTGCNTTHDRDVNAAKNLMTVGQWHQVTGQVISTASQYQYILGQK